MVLNLIGLIVALLIGAMATGLISFGIFVYIIIGLAALVMILGAAYALPMRENLPDKVHEDEYDSCM